MISTTLCKSCNACAAACPQNAISLLDNSQGFKRVNIDDNKCIGCGICEKVCSATEEDLLFHKNITVYAAKSLSEKVRLQSRSGGIFYELAKDILVNGGVVYGAALVDNGARHIRLETVDELSKICGSKYVWSTHEDCFSVVVNDLKSNRQVLFSGLPCQIAGLKAYLNNDGIQNDNLILCDIICHGVSSPKLLKDYLEYMEKKYKEKVIKFDFRNKINFGWKAHLESVYFRNKTLHTDMWTNLFYSHLSLRSSCFTCRYKSTERVGDISLGDCWNIEKTDSCLNDDNGASLVLLNTEKGKHLFERLQTVYMEEISLSDYMQPALFRSVEKPDNYDDFWRNYTEQGFSYILKTYAGNNFKGRMRTRIKVLYYKYKRGKL